MTLGEADRLKRKHKKTRQVRNSFNKLTEYIQLDESEKAAILSITKKLDTKIENDKVKVSEANKILNKLRSGPSGSEFCKKCGIEASPKQIKEGKCCKLAKKYKGKKHSSVEELPDYDMLRNKNDLFGSGKVVSGGGVGVGKGKR